MKKLLSIVILLLIFSCSENKKEPVPIYGKVDEVRYLDINMFIAVLYDVQPGILYVINDNTDNRKAFLMLDSTLIKTGDYGKFALGKELYQISLNGYKNGKKYQEKISVCELIEYHLE